MSALKQLFKKQPGGSPAGNLIRRVLYTKTAGLLGSATGVPRSELPPGEVIAQNQLRADVIKGAADGAASGAQREAEQAYIESVAKGRSPLPEAAPSGAGFMVFIRKNLVWVLTGLGTVVTVAIIALSRGSRRARRRR